MKPLQADAIIYILLFFLTLTSCNSTKDAIYFNNIQNAEFQGVVENLEPVIQKNDLLSIKVNSLNPEATEIFNDPNSGAARSSNTTSAVSQATGYLVDQEGNIQFPLLGKIKAEGITKKDLGLKIRSELINKKYLVDPVIDIRYLNYKISVLGEVQQPSVLTVPNEKIALLEALGLAGDLTIYANRKNVLLIREEQGKKQLRRIDLTSAELFTSPYYYLKSNDIIYVEPNKTKIQNAGFARQWLPVVFSGLSVIVIAIDRITR